MKNRLREIREALGMSQGTLGDLCGTTAQQIGMLEMGKRGLDTDWMERISRALNIEPWMLLVDPVTIISDSDRERISKFHALPPELQKAVDAIIASATIEQEP